MLYRVTIDGSERTLDVDVSPSGAIHVRLEGEAVDADVVELPDGLTVRVGHRIFDIATGGGAERLQVRAGAAMTEAEVVSPRARKKKANASGGLGGAANELRAPMPGRVVKVTVKAGDTVDAGAPCVVIEAMKMENELLVPGAAARTVREVHATEGASVEAQALLVTFEPA